MTNWLSEEGIPIDSEEGKARMAVMAKHLKSLCDECGPEVIIGMTQEELEAEYKPKEGGND